MHRHITPFPSKEEGRNVDSQRFGVFNEVNVWSCSGSPCRMNVCFRRTMAIHFVLRLITTRIHWSVALKLQEDLYRRVTKMFTKLKRACLWLDQMKRKYVPWFLLETAVVGSLNLARIWLGDVELVQEMLDEKVYLAAAEICQRSSQPVCT